MREYLPLFNCNMYHLFIFTISDGDCSHEIKRHLLLGRIAITNLDNILKSRHYFTNKVHLVKAMVFPVVMYGRESWTIKKAEHWRIDAFELWCWRLLRVPWSARRSHQSIKEISPEHSLEGLDAEAETPILWPHDVKNWLTGIDPDAGKIEGRRRRGPQRMRWLDGITDSMVWVSSRSWWCIGKPGVLQSIGSQIVGHDWVTELNWTISETLR